jgi:hypothetical protein
MIPTTSTPWFTNEAAHVEITALAAGAGPPANRMATRRIGRPVGLGSADAGTLCEADIRCSIQIDWVFENGRGRAVGGFDGTLKRGFLIVTH